MLSKVVAAFSLLAIVSSAQRAGTDPASPCTQRSACEPWDTQGGRFCARGEKIRTVFFLELPDEDQDPQFVPTPLCDVGGETAHNVSYSFCPGVDELQSFNLTLSGQLTSTYVNATSNTRLQSNTNGTYLHYFGGGTFDSRELPIKKVSQGAVKISGPCPHDPLQTAIVPFLVLNLSMDLGRFKYLAGYPQPAGTGFTPTCSTDSRGKDLCLLDSTLPCFGDEGAKNCASCYSGTSAEGVERLVETHINVWVSYYGTDRNGRQLRSGSNNPLNFRAWNSGGMYNALSDSLSDVGSGDFGGDPNDPAVRLRRHIVQLKQKILE